MHHSYAMPYFPNLHIFLYFQSSLRSSDEYCVFKHGYHGTVGLDARTVVGGMA